MSTLTENLQFLSNSTDRPLAGIMRGIEKESLRVTPGGHLSPAAHPKQLGSALTHPSITTDFSEALLEFITPPSTSVSTVLQQLEDIHTYVYQNIQDERLWGHSMPCMLGNDGDIPVGQYGSSNIGQMKTIYRTGLGHRYGRLMQTIAGIHYNFSIPDELWEILREKYDSSLSLQDFKTEQYLSLIRNFRRYFWLLLYLFGSAPAVCRSFVRDRKHQLIPVGKDNHSLHAPFATSLRMGNLGYQSNAQQGLAVCYNDLPSYISTLREALTQSYPDYQAIGIKDEAGHYRQLSANLLQIENEFYSTIRPKRTAQSGQAPLAALQTSGIEYIEVRCLDLDPFSPIGISKQQIHFLDTFLVFCLLSDSPLTTKQEHQQLTENHHKTVYQGRDPELLLHSCDGKKPLPVLAEQLFTEMDRVAELLDQQQQTESHTASLKHFRTYLNDPSLTPSARLVAEMKNNDKSYFQMAMSHADQHRNHFRNRSLAPSTVKNYQDIAAQSIKEQQAIEAVEQLPMDEFLDDYFSQYQQL